MTDRLTSGVQHLDAQRHAQSARYTAALSRLLFTLRQQAGEVLDRIVRLEVRRLVGDEAVPERVALVERVVGELLDDVEQLLAERLRRTRWRRSRPRTSARSLAITSRIFLPIALRRLSASASV